MDKKKRIYILLSKILKIKSMEDADYIYCTCMTQTIGLMY